MRAILLLLLLTYLAAPCRAEDAQFEVDGPRAQRLHLRSQRHEDRVRGDAVETRYVFVFDNPSNPVGTGYFTMHLPKRSVVSSCRYRGQPQPTRIVDASSARDVFEVNLQSRSGDASVAEVAGNRLDLRLFPIPRGAVDIQVVLLKPRGESHDARFHLDRLPEARVLASSAKYGIIVPWRTASLSAGTAALAAYRKEQLRRARETLQSFTWTVDQLRKEKPPHPNDGGFIYDDDNEMSRGDPVLKVRLPADARLTALLPGGTLTPLVWDGRLWVLRFDIPMEARDGPYPVTVHIRLADGAAYTRVAVFKVGGYAADEQQTLEPVTVTCRESASLELPAPAGTRRAIAVFPWGTCELPRLSSGRFLVSLPSAGDGTVVFISGGHRRLEVPLCVRSR